MHQHPGAAGVAHHAGHVGVGEAAGDVVDHGRTGGEGRLGDPRAGRVDADRHAGGGQLPDHGDDPGRLGRRVDAVGTGPGGLAAHVHQVGALGPQPHAVSDGGIEVGVPSAVGEGVGRDVEDAHHHRPRPVPDRSRLDGTGRAGRPGSAGSRAMTCAFEQVYDRSSGSDRADSSRLVANSGCPYALELPGIEMAKPGGRAEAGKSAQSSPPSVVGNERRVADAAHREHRSRQACLLHHRGAAGRDLGRFQ